MGKEEAWLSKKGVSLTYRGERADPAGVRRDRLCLVPRVRWLRDVPRLRDVALTVEGDLGVGQVVGETADAGVGRGGFDVQERTCAGC